MGRVAECGGARPRAQAGRFGRLSQNLYYFTRFRTTTTSSGS
jgi:hypothetical protein